MKNRRSLSAVIAGVLAIGLMLTFVAGAGAKNKVKTYPDRGTTYVAIVHGQGAVLDAAGYGFDRQFGHIGVTYLTTVAPGTTGTIKVLIKRVTEYTSVGSLYGTASAVQNLTTGAITNGKLDLRHGTGELKGYEFVGTFSGSYDSSTKIYTFHYSGKLR